MNQATALAKILDYETGDSWNGTHGRTISVAFNAEAAEMTVTSTNNMVSTCTREVVFPLHALEQILQEAEVRRAKYYASFIGQYAGLKPEMDAVAAAERQRQEISARHGQAIDALHQNAKNGKALLKPGKNG